MRVAKAKNLIQLKNVADNFDFYTDTKNNDGQINLKGMMPRKMNSKVA